MVAGDVEVFFTSTDLDKLKSKFEINIVMEKRMHDTCQYIEYGL